MLRADLHVHTCHSPDSSLPLGEIVRRCQRRGINCIAVTDHGTISGALALREIAPFKVIVGQEILTPFGEIMGLFLKEAIPRGLPPEEAAGRVRDQGGLVCIPHPCDRCRPRSALSSTGRQRVLDQADIIEVFNARTILRRDLDRARELAQQNGLLCSAGSDAHTAGEVGNAYVEMPDFDGAEGFREALRQGRIVGRQTSPLVHSITTTRKLVRLLRRGLGGG